MNEMNNTKKGLTYGSLIFGSLLILSAVLVFYPLISSLSDTINTMNEHPELREALLDY